MQPSVAILEVDLAVPPRERWQGLVQYREAIRELTAIYERDLAVLRGAREWLERYRALQATEHLEELEGIAALSGTDPLDLFLVNAYYDVFKHAMGCTAFALDTRDGPLHARNLDWHTERDALSRHTLLVRYHDGPRLLFESAGWPGFIGTMSGVACGRFAVSLNAVLSEDAAEVAPPIAFVLRGLLARADYAQAVSELSSRMLSCDCLLLVSGVEDGEMCVIERTPTRAAVRHPRADEGALVVTNDYRLLSDPSTTTTELALTSCGRYERAETAVLRDRPASADACFSILSATGVRMEMTVQQMVMSARAGSMVLRPGRG